MEEEDTSLTVKNIAPSPSDIHSASGAGGTLPAPVPPAPPTPSQIASPTAAGSNLSGPPSAVALNAPGVSKRRRGLGVVTPNACTECRKKRAKCDGQRPCGRCRAQKDVECVYEIPVRQSKENLRNEIEQLRRQQRNSDLVIAALARPDLWEEVLARLRNGQSVDSISQWLGGMAPLESQRGGPGATPGESSKAGAAIGANRTTGPSSSGFSGVAALSGVGNAPYGPLPTGLRNASPVPSPHAPHHRHDTEQNSPWGTGGPFSSHSQTQSTRSGSFPDVMNWGSDTNRGGRQARVGSWLESQGPTDAHRYGLHNNHVVMTDVPDMKVPAGTWTNITSDSNLVQHLLALYFCWEYPTFASLSKEHFLKDFQEGRPRFCSSILVNALLALGCRFSSQPNTRANPNDPYSSGDHFFKESQRLLHQDGDHHKLTTIQALGIMSIREASCGRDSESWYFAGQSIRLAIEMGLHQIKDAETDDDEIAVQSATFWGAFALDQAWSLATGSLPQTSCFPHLPPKPAIIDDIEASLWIPYTDDGLPLQRSCEQPSNVRSVYKCFCELSELVHQSLYVLHSPGRPLTSRDLLKIYTQYLNWYDKIPEVLRLGHNFTPAVLFAHMYYHFAILLLFRPLIKLRIIGSSILPRDVCLQAADAIQGLLRSYSQLYTLRRTPSFVPYFVLTSAIMHLAIGAATSTPTSQRGTGNQPSGLHGGQARGGGSAGRQHGQRPRSSSPKTQPHVVEAISRGIADLTEMAPCHHFAEQALNILRFLAKKWNIDVDIRTGAQDSAGSDDAVEFPGTRPVTTSLNFFAPNVVEQDFICRWGPTAEPDSGPQSGQRAMKMNPQMMKTLENPLFWPFPMQGRPMLPSGDQLTEAGFELL
ncbi:hypothetical protein VTK73DRAFT_1010 [Phialemonium thermophilum]|uniref:Zn(2)-C6 fungal-type domain-containing protein n=1 Tax=Phialemonium thermophilum TaxID=223376 RepID=A0ABR3XCS0_9PEZI